MSKKTKVRMVLGTIIALTGSGVVGYFTMGSGAVIVAIALAVALVENVALLTASFFINENEELLRYRIQNIELKKALDSAKNKTAITS